MSNQTNAAPKRVTTLDLLAMKKRGQKWAMLTAYDSMMGGIFDEAGLPVLLVGDSAGNNFFGQENTIPVTVEQLIPLARAVVSATNQSLVVADFPFGSYESGPDLALETGIRFFKEAGVQAVKLEGGARIAPQIKKLVESGIPVMGHLGLTPQSVHALGGFKVQGRGLAGEQIKSDARALVAAGIFALVLELVPQDLAREISTELSIPVIGIGAGNGCDAQVLVWTDLMGLTPSAPKLAKAYRNLRSEMLAATKEWAADVASGQFPGPEQSFQ